MIDITIMMIAGNTMIGRNTTIILRTTNNCNLNCKYCYAKNEEFAYGDSDTKFKKNIYNLINYIEKLRLYKDKKINVILHGGEPLLIKASTYEEFFKALQEKNIPVNLSVQTNGTLINKSTLEILKKYDVHIGISLDGSDETQNSNRLYHNGKNSFKEVMKTINLLNKENIRFGVIITISKSNIGREAELYNFIAKNQLNCSIRPAFPVKQVENNKNIMTNDEYFNFFIRLFDIWYNDERFQVSIKQIAEFYDEFVKLFNNLKYRPSCTNCENCFGNFVSLDVDGNLYTCNRTYNVEQFYLGNINRENIKTIIKKVEKLKNDRINYIKQSKCNKCELYKTCYGGCPANSFELYGDYKLPYMYFCDANIKIYNYIKDKLVREGQIDLMNQILDESGDEKNGK